VKSCENLRGKEGTGKSITRNCPLEVLEEDDRKQRHGGTRGQGRKRNLSGRFRGQGGATMRVKIEEKGGKGKEEEIVVIGQSPRKSSRLSARKTKNPRSSGGVRRPSRERKRHPGNVSEIT